MSDGCKKYEPLLHCLLDGEVTEEERREVQAHLAACPACAERYRELEALHRALQDLDVPVPEGLRERTMARIRQERTAARQRAVARWSRGLLAAAACCAIVFLGARWMPFDHLTSGSSQNDAAASGGGMNGASSEPAAPYSLEPDGADGAAEPEDDLPGMTCTMAPEDMPNSGGTGKQAMNGQKTDGRQEETPEDTDFPYAGFDGDSAAGGAVLTVETSEEAVGLWLASNRSGEEGPYFLTAEESASLNGCLEEADLPALPEGPVVLVYQPQEPAD